MAFGNRLVNTSTGGGGGGPVYLAANGVTVIADPSAVSGQVYVLNGVSYLVLANRAALDSAFNSGRDMATVVTTRVTSFSFLFEGESSFNDDISSWDTSSVTNMSSCFIEVDDFNQDIGNWDTSNVTTMNNMLQRTADFNQDLTGWCVTNITREPRRWASGNRVFLESNWPVWGTCP
jgi:surface protein